MKRSEVLNQQAPRPLDNAVEKVYKRFVALQKEVLHNRRNEVANGLLGQRHYEDLKDLRMDVTRGGTIIVRIKPIIGVDTEEDIKFYADFFKLYNKLNREVMRLIYTLHTTLVNKERNDEEFNRAESIKVWKAANSSHVHQLVMALKILVSAMNMGKLQADDLYRFDRQAFCERGDEAHFVPAMDALVFEYDLSDLISTQFGHGDASFYQYPDTELVGAYYRYVKKTTTS